MMGVVVTHCCEMMTTTVNGTCGEHSEPWECPDWLVVYVPEFREYGLVVHDGGGSYVSIGYCPWCGAELPASVRDRWFDELERLGLEREDAPPYLLDGSWLEETER
jgi:hypothetical protein